MTVFVLCSATAAAAMAVAFEVGRVAEKRLSGASKTALPFEGFDWASEQTKTAAFVFAGLMFIEVAFLPRAWNPFSYLAGGANSAYSSLMAFLVFGSWSGILAVGFGGIATSFQALNIERKSLDRVHSDLKAQRSKLDKELEAERQTLEKTKRTNLASAAALAGEWKKLHIAREEDLHRNLERSENEKIWSKTITQEFDKKVMHVVDNATDKRWREIQDQDLTLEAMRFRNREKEKQLKEQRALRAERATSEKETLKNETSKLLQMTDEFENLKTNIDKLKEEKTKKEQEMIQDLKEREMAVLEKEKTLAEAHQQKLEELKEQEIKLKSKEEELESGEEHKKLQELSQQLESSKLTVAKFNEEVMKKEKAKLEEFRVKELELKKREEELAKKAKVKHMSDDMMEERSVQLQLMSQNVVKNNSSRDNSSKKQSFLALQKTITADESIQDDRNDVSDSDSISVSHLIQRDIAAVGRNTIIRRSMHFNIPTPLSPLQETFRNTFFAAKKQKPPKNIVTGTIPKTPSAAKQIIRQTISQTPSSAKAPYRMDTIPTNASSNSNVWDAISMTSDPNHGRPEKRVQVARAYQRRARAAPPSPMRKSIRDYAREKSFVVSEDAAVEVIAYNE